ncbi:uncharacterized protein (TIGR03084 family) [Antricoccus suffuscus]|uniref:Uncharacterized protein (TIGR03084 family) n=1 Tax=Antricoccus suffuscus TaxID=1629062 RepID=A0A2T0ZWJ0_9ACTN|nr:TIGR03084 family metal-binding protein [Antricoccus suffuscus]PRZ40719.1 uncharacterized protein (TIGR03084 family) [Antricoccus suffuscus]
MADLASIVNDLVAEGDDLDSIVAGLQPDQWRTSTPAPGWTVAHQIAHLRWTDRASVKAATDPDAFKEILTQSQSQPNLVDVDAANGAREDPAELLATWRETRRDIADVLLATKSGEKLPWFGPPMNAVSMATARLMETWAHGQDVADGLGLERTPTDRLKNVAHIAYRARGFAYMTNNLTPPDSTVYLELAGPSGELWTWGDPHDDQSVKGSALDFCLLAVQRRHRNDCDVTANGAEADHWLEIIQAFAGPPGAKREEAHA